MLGDRLRELRRAAGLTQDRVAELLCEQTGRPTTTRWDVSRWERGTRTPTTPTLRALAGILGADLRDLEIARVAPDEEAADRARYVLDRPAAVDTATVEALAVALAAQRRVEDVAGPAPVLDVVTATERLTDTIVREAAGPVRGRLLGLASELAQYRGWLSIALRRWDAARAALDRSTALGVEAGDPLRVPLALSYRAYESMLTGDLRTADHLVAAAGRAGGVHVGLRAYLAHQRAEITAADHDHAAARRHLHEAEALADRLPAPAELPSWGYWYTPGFFAGIRAMVLDTIGEHREARRLADTLSTAEGPWVDLAPRRNRRGRRS